MPNVIGGKLSTYLLLSGIKVAREVRLAPGVTLVPIREKDGPRPLLSKLDLLDKHFAVLLLPWIECQLRVEGKGGRDVATRAWNSLWDVLLLSAIFGVPITAALQSTSALENFTEKSRLNVVDYRILSFPMNDSPALSDADCTWLEQNFCHSQRLLSEHGFQNAVHCLATYHWHTLPRARLALLWAGIEGLFAVDSEIVFRVSLYSAKFLAPDDPSQQKQIFSDVKRLYGVRSKAVHGGKLKGDPHDSVVESVALLGRLVRACIEQQRLPVPEQLVP